MNQRKTRWINGATAAAFWGATIITADLGLNIRWYLAIWLATLVSTLCALISVVDGMIRARQAETISLARALTEEGVREVKQAIAEHSARMEDATQAHAARMEDATQTHGDKMEKSAFSAQRWNANGYRGATLAKLDAAEAAAQRAKDDTGPFSAARGRG